jgi:hypothetical protein
MTQLIYQRFGQSADTDDNARHEIDAIIRNNQERRQARENLGWRRPIQIKISATLYITKFKSLLWECCNESLPMSNVKAGAFVQEVHQDVTGTRSNLVNLFGALLQDFAEDNFLDIG